MAGGANGTVAIVADADLIYSALCCNMIREIYSIEI